MVSSGPRGYLLTHNIAHDGRKSLSIGLGVMGLSRENSRQIGLLSTVTQLKHSERFERSEAIERLERIQHLRYDTAHRRAERRIFPNVKLRARLEGNWSGYDYKKARDMLGFTAR
jgi:hypothetical protein